LFLAELLEVEVLPTSLELMVLVSEPIGLATLVLEELPAVLLAAEELLLEVVVVLLRL